MTTDVAPHPLLTVEQYRARERRSDVRHEYVQGRIYAMSGESRAHNEIAGNVVARPRAARGAGSGRMSFESVRLVAAAGVEYYPEVMVACGPPPDDRYIETAPCVLVQVLSPSTRRTDRREKGAAYRAIDTLDAYIIVHQSARRVEWYTRDAATREWRVADVVGQGVIAFPCPVGPDGAPVTMTLDELYDSVELPPPREPRRDRASS